MSTSRKPNEYKRSFAFRFKQWMSGEKDPYIGVVEMQPQTPQENPELKYQSLDQNVIRELAKEKSVEKHAMKNSKLYWFISLVTCLAFMLLLIYTVSFLPPVGDPANPVNNEVAARYIERGLQETGAVNIVTGLILDYRAFDTFGESCVLFIACACVQIILRLDEGSKHPGTKEQIRIAETDRRFEPKNDVILQKVAKVLVPLLLMFGVYIILNGHLSPGGGFSGGAVVGATLILYLSAYGFEKTERFFTYRTFRVVSLCALSFYGLAKSYSFFTGANHLESGIPIGTPGAILSSGLIFPLNICVGLVVTCTMYALYALFRRGRV